MLRAAVLIGVLVIVLTESLSILGRLMLPLPPLVWG